MTETHFLECNHCFKTLPTKAFYKHSGKARGYQYICRECDTMRKRFDKRKYDNKGDYISTNFFPFLMKPIQIQRP